MRNALRPGLRKASRSHSLRPVTYCWAAIEEIDAMLSSPLHHGRSTPQAARRSRAASARLAARSTFSRAPRTFAGNLTPA